MPQRSECRGNRDWSRTDASQQRGGQSKGSRATGRYVGWEDRRCQREVSWLHQHFYQWLPSTVARSRLGSAPSSKGQSLLTEIWKVLAPSLSWAEIVIKVLILLTHIEMSWAHKRWFGSDQRVGVQFCLSFFYWRLQRTKALSIFLSILWKVFHNYPWKQSETPVFVLVYSTWSTMLSLRGLVRIISKWCELTEPTHGHQPLPWLGCLTCCI